MPIVVAPTAFHRLACETGEIATARAAKAAGTLFILSSLSNTPMETVFAEAASPRWFQLYVYKDREITHELVQRAEAAAYVRANFKSDLGLADLDWLCGMTRLPVVVKGVCRGEDARAAAGHGAKAVVVSNHGGRQLDTAPATSEVLPRVAEAAGDLCEVYVDGGIRRGADVLKAIALGARAVLVGRPILWGLAVDGEAGAQQLLEILRRELDEAMLLCGCPKLSDIGRWVLAP